MLLKFLDIFNTFCQACLFVWITHIISAKDNKISGRKSFILVMLIFIDCVLFTYIDINAPVANFLMVFIVGLLLAVFYRKSILDALSGFGLSYFLITVTSYFPAVFYQYYFSKLNLPSEIGIFLFIYIPIFILYLIFYLIRKYILAFGIFFKNLKHSLIIVLLIDYFMLFLNTIFMEWVSHNMTPIFKAFLYATFFIIFMFTAIYFAKIYDNSKEIEVLNAALSEKITELKKIKHDYGSEISGLYGLYQMGRIERLGELLKSILERDQAINTGVTASIKSNPIVSSALQSANSSGINVIVFDNADYENLSISDNDLLKVISNVIKNSVDALSAIKNPTIRYKSYNSFNGIIITIMNNGPEIPNRIKNKIFESGFSTKDNGKGDRGYGLCIVKEIMDSCEGIISVESNQEWTEFKLEIPYKEFHKNSVKADNTGGNLFEEIN